MRREVGQDICGIFHAPSAQEVERLLTAVEDYEIKKTALTGFVNTSPTSGSYTVTISASESIETAFKLRLY